MMSDKGFKFHNNLPVVSYCRKRQNTFKITVMLILITTIKIKYVISDFGR